MTLDSNSAIKLQIIKIDLPILLPNFVPLYLTVQGLIPFLLKPLHILFFLCTSHSQIQGGEMLCGNNQLFPI